MPHCGASKEYPQQMFSWRNKKNINTFGLKKASYQELWTVNKVSATNWTIYWPTNNWYFTWEDIFLLSSYVQMKRPASVAQSDALLEIRLWVWTPPGPATFFHGDWSGNIFYGHHLPSAGLQEGHLSVSGESMGISTGWLLRGLSLVR